MRMGILLLSDSRVLDLKKISSIVLKGVPKSGWMQAYPNGGIWKDPLKNVSLVTIIRTFHTNFANLTFIGLGKFMSCGFGAVWQLTRVVTIA